MGIIEEKLFFSGTNSDDEDRKLQQGDFRFALNVETDNVDSSNVGAVVNSKGNRLITTQLPAGTNKVIGSKEDLDSNSCIYFLYNSNGDHSIYRFLSDAGRIDLVMQTSLFNFSLDHRINHINVIDEKLLLWTDGYNPPRQINLDKAIEYGKKRKWNIYWGDTFNVGQYYDTTLFFPNGSVAFTWRTTIPSGLTPSDAYGMSRYYVSNIPITLRTFASFTTCGASVEIEMMITGEYTVQILPSLSNQSIVVADNFYPTPYDEAFIDRLMQPFHCQPEAVYKFDSSRKTNLVQNRVFQFATRYIYDDYEKSAISPYSVIPTSEGDCNAIAAFASLNYIEIDFTEARLNDPIFRSEIRGIDIIFREHNTGKLKLITTLLPENFGIGVNKFKFYNDGIYAGVPDSEAAKNFDSIPIVSGAQEYVNNRVFDSNILEGYDTVCIDADLNIEYKQIGGVNLSGSLFIIQPDQSASGYQGGPINGYRTTPVFSSSNYFGGTGSLFGGLLGSWYQPAYPPYNGNPSHGISSNIAQYCEIPLSGFTIYLSGTEYSSVTKQRKIIDTATGNQIQAQDIQSGVVNINNESFFNVINDISNHSVRYSSSFVQDWVIPGVKPGIYSLRVAGHEITDIDPDLDYQKTSTRILTESIIGLGNQTGVCESGCTEAIVEILPNGTVNIRNPKTFNIISTTTGSCGNTYIRDVSTADYLNQGYGVDLYIVDGEGASAPLTAAAMLNFQRVTKTSVTLWNLLVSTSFQYYITTETDHNGFAYMWSSVNIAGIIGSPIVTLRLVDITNSVIISDPNGIQCYRNNGTYPATDQNDLDQRKYIFFYNDVNFTASGRTFVEGYLFDINGNVAEDVVVCSTFHGAVKTNNMGFFSFSYYANNPTATQSDYALFSTNGICSLSSFPSYVFYQFDPVIYNNNNHYIIQTPIIIYSYSETTTLKRGYDGQFGIVYYDKGNRSSTVNTSEKTNVHVLFYTEKDPITGTFYYSETPQAKWAIRHTPPEWATHYQWVRTKNLQLNYYLQFVANKVEYVKEPTSSAAVEPFITATYARIDLNNLTTYRDDNANSLLAYTWQVGDRIRFISQYGNNYYSDYFDYEIQAEDGGFIFIQKDNIIGQIRDGVFFEIYSPRLNTDKKLFYEIGECFDVRKDNNGKPYHEGPEQNQDPLNPSGIPAKGTIKTGDAWYRGRVIPYTYSGSDRSTLYNIDDASISDFYLSKDDNIGRINIEDLDSQQIHREKTVRFSDIYVKESKLNGLSSYSALNYENIKKGEGPVYKLQRSGRVLLTIQRSQVNSLYIEEIVYIDANGNPSLTVSDKVIGTIRPQEMQYGSVHPESVKEYAGIVYWYDVTKGTVIRYSNDGLTPIGDYKMKSFFRNITREVISFPIGDIECLGGYDPLNKRYLLSFVKRDNLLNFVNRTCGFSEPSNRWMGDYSFIPESMTMTGMDVVTFKDGELWVHDNPIRNNFYGVQYTSKLGAVSNQESGKVRNFIGISEETNEVWACPEIEVPPNAQFPTGMISRLIKSKFVNKEGVFYAALLKDMNSPNFPTPTDALISGRDLRGHVLRITLENDSTIPVILNAINVRYIYSEPSKK